MGGCYLAGGTGSSSPPRRYSCMPATRSRIPVSPWTVLSPPSAKPLGEPDDEPSRDRLPSGTEGAPGPSRHPRKKPNSPHTTRDSARVAVRTPRMQQGRWGAPARTLACRGAKPPWGSCRLDPVVRGTKKVEGRGLRASITPLPSPGSTKQGVLGQNTLVRPPQTPVRTSSGSWVSPELPLLPFWGHS